VKRINKKVYEYYFNVKHKGSPDYFGRKYYFILLKIQINNYIQEKTVTNNKILDNIPKYYYNI